MTNRQMHTAQEQVLIDTLLSALTPREREVLSRVITGHLNKQIAHDLCVSQQTVKVHRGRLMTKLGIRSIVDLVRFSVWTGLLPNVCPLRFSQVDGGAAATRGPAITDSDQLPADGGTGSPC